MDSLIINKKTQLVITLVIFLLMELLVGTSDNVISGFFRLIVIVIFVYCISKGVKEHCFLNPYFMFCITPLSLLMYSEEFSPYYLNKLELSTWGIAIINMVAFLITLNCTDSKFKIRFGNRSLIDNSYVIPPEKLINSNLIAHSIILCIIGVTPAIASIIGVSLPMRYLLKYALFIGVSFAFKSKRISVILFSLSMSLINFIDDFNKTELLFLVITIAASFESYYIKTAKDRVKFLSLAIISGLFMIVIAFPLKSFSRGGGNFFVFLNNASQIASSEFSWVDDRINFNGPYFLQMPYMYLIQAWNNVQYVIKTQDTYTYGLWMLKPLLGYFQIDSFFEEQYILIPASNFNTFTYITVLFKDFGYWGSAFGSAFLGFYVKKIYGGYEQEGSAFGTASYALVAMATLEMFFSNHFFGLAYPFTIVILGYIYKRIFKLKGY